MIPVIKYTREQIVNEYEVGRRDFVGLNLSGIDLSRTVLPGINFSGSDLCEANFDRANLTNANFFLVDACKASFVKANMEKSSLTFANLTDADMTSANFLDAYLSFANFTRTKLVHSNLEWSSLTEATFYGADLTKANLDSAKCHRAVFSDATLTGASFNDTELTEAIFNVREPFDWASLKRARRITGLRKIPSLPAGVPKVKNLDRKIFEIVRKNPDQLNMRYWHKCQTTHCRAGWAITLAEEAGKKLQKKYGPMLAAALIYYRSEGYIPDFFEIKERDVIVELEKRAQESKGPRCHV